MSQAAVGYIIPERWIKYNPLAIINELIEAKAAVLSLTTIPFQREWVDKLQEIQLKREVAGTSRIEGADFTDSELSIALQESPEQLRTRSQRQAHAAVQTYRWIAKLEDDRPIDADLIREVHRRIVTGADDDHCEPGKLRGPDQNVVFGLPPHRGVDGGDDCVRAFSGLAIAIKREFPGYDPLVQALSLHYHFAAMHPFLDGNGRTARALEALVLQRAGLRDSLFIAMSNYYYDEKNAYLRTLAEVRANGHDLTPFLKFGLRGIALQCGRLFTEIRTNVAKALFRNMMDDLFGRLRTPKRRVIGNRQRTILTLLLDQGELSFQEIVRRFFSLYETLGNPGKAVFRDLGELVDLGAVHVREDGHQRHFSANLEWPSEITESRFMDFVRNLPKAKPQPFAK